MRPQEARAAGLLLALSLALALACLAGCDARDGTARNSVDAARELRPGKTEAGSLTGSAPAAFRVSLDAGESLHVTFEQQGVDIVTVLLDKEGREILALDSPTGEHGPEHLFFVAEESGSFRLEARPFAPDGRGSYRVQMERRAALFADRLRARACRGVSEADALTRKEGPEARRDAFRRYAEAIDLWRETGEAYQEAVARIKLGKALVKAGESRSSAQQLERALALFKALGIESRQPALLNDLGVTYERLGVPGRARSSFEAAQASARRLGDRREETAAINNLGLLEQDSGEPWRALLLLDEALAGWRELGDARGEAATLHNQGTLYTLLGRLPEARRSLELALYHYRASGRPLDEAPTLVALGWARYLQGDIAGARRDLLRSLDLRRTGGDRRGEAVTLDRLGTLSRETGDLERAVAEYRQALAILQEIGDPKSRARTLSNLGETLTLQGHPEHGLHYQDEALRYLEDEGAPSAEAYARFRRAKAKRALGDHDAAWADMKKAIPRLEEIRARAESNDLRRTYFDSVHEQYEFAVDLLMELHSGAPGSGFDRLALEMAERAQARGLLDLVQEARGRRAVEQLGEHGRSLRRLDGEIRAAEQRQAERTAAGGRESEGAIEEARIRRLLREREKVLLAMRLRERGRELAARPLNASEIRRELLGTGTVLLIYSLGERRSFVWAISEQGIESAVLPERTLLEQAAVRLHGLLAGQGRRTGQIELTAKELSRLLLHDVAHRLKTRRVVVVPDGALAYIPFGALPDPVNGGPLLVRHEVVMLPSVSVLAAVRERAATRKPPPRLLAVLADPVFNRDDPRLTQVRGTGGEAQAAPDGKIVTRAARSLRMRTLARLPYSGREAESILALARPEQSLKATAFAATPELVTSGRLEEFRIVHFATHALINPRYPELSGVILSLFDQHGQPRPGFLRPHQIFSLHLPADLVVLSACRTGLGQEVEGEGLVGLTQSFFHAGTSRVIVSLWDVDDQATALLMERFYRELLHVPQSPAAALRAAQLWMREDPRWSAPYYWAGFVIQGDWT